jgi:hypothetical protein
MPCGNFLLHHMPHNIKPSLTIIMDDGDQYFEKKLNFMLQNLHSATCHILIYG